MRFASKSDAITGWRTGPLKQSELGDRLLALYIPGKRLRIRLNQARRHELGTATLIEPLPRLQKDEVSAKRFAVTLNLRQIVRWFGYCLPGKHRTVVNVITSESRRVR